jgi:hypothetical protein
VLICISASEADNPGMKTGEALDTLVVGYAPSNRSLQLTAPVGSNQAVSRLPSGSLAQLTW